MNQKFKKTKLKELVSSISSGVSVNSDSRPAEPNNEAGILKTSCLTGCNFNPSENKVILADEVNRAKLNPKKDSILVSRMNTPKLVGENAYVGNDYNNLYVPDRIWQLEIDKSKANSKFLSYILSSSRFRAMISNCATGTSNSMKNISQESFLGLSLSVPSLIEQQKIAEILSKWDEAIEKLEKLIRLTTVKKHSLFKKLITSQSGQKLKIKDFAEVIAGGTPSTRIKKYWNGNIRWMSSGEINKKIIAEVDGRITEEGLLSSSAKLIPIKSVLVALAGQGTTRGKVAINEVELSTNQSLAAIIPDKMQVNPYYLYFNLDSRYQEIRSLSTGDGGRGGLNLNIIKNISVVMPDMEKQNAISDFFKSLSIELSVLNEYKNILTKQKQGLMQKLLTGKVRVN